LILKMQNSVLSNSMKSVLMLFHNMSIHTKILMKRLNKTGITGRTFTDKLGEDISPQGRKVE